MTELKGHSVDTLDDQVNRAYQQYQSRESDLLKNSFLQSLKCRPSPTPPVCTGLTDVTAQNLVLFYSLLSRHLTEMFPIVYTPTEADAIAEYSHLFRRSEGLYLTPEEEDTMRDDFLDACEGRDLDLVCHAIGYHT